MPARKQSCPCGRPGGRRTGPRNNRRIGAPYRLREALAWSNQPVGPAAEKVSKRCVAEESCFAHTTLTPAIRPAGIVAAPFSPFASTTSGRSCRSRRVKRNRRDEDVCSTGAGGENRDGNVPSFQLGSQRTVSEQHRAYVESCRVVEDAQEPDLAPPTTPCPLTTVTCRRSRRSSSATPRSVAARQCGESRVYATGSRSFADVSARSHT